MRYFLSQCSYISDKLTVNKNKLKDYYAKHG